MHIQLLQQWKLRLNFGRYRLDSGVSDTNRIMSNGACAIAIAELNIRSVASYMHYQRQFDLYDSLNHTILAFPVLMFW